MPGDTLLPVLASTGGAIGALMLLTWLWSVLRKDAGVVELAWPVGLVLAAGLALLLGEASGPRKLLVPALVGLWGARLFFYLVWRNLFAHLHPGADLNEHEDRRMKAGRRKHGKRFWLVSLFTVFLPRAVALWLVALPVTVVQTVPGRTDLFWLDYVAAIVVVGGLLLEAVADGQLSSFKLNPGSHGQVLTTGLWRYSRHPNYFGELLVGWGLYAMVLGSSHLLAATILGPVLLTAMLLRLNGISRIEDGMEARRPGYGRYAARTSALLPLPPRAAEPRPARA